MGLIKKPNKKRHRVQKDPYAIALKKAKKKQVRRTRRAEEAQEVPRADRAVMQFLGGSGKKSGRSSGDGDGEQQQRGQQPNKRNETKNKNKRKPDKLLDSTQFREAVEPYQPGMDKPLKPVPVCRQRPGETGREFMFRVRKATWNVLEQSRFEDRYEVDVWQDPQTGKVDLKSRKQPSMYANDVEAELAAMKRRAEADPGIKKHVKFGQEVKVADPVKKAEEEAEKERASGNPVRKSRKAQKTDASARKVVKERNRCKLLKARKKLKRIGGSLKPEAADPSLLVPTDNVRFGEVVSAPPLLEHKPRKAEDKKTNRPGRKDLLLKRILEKAAPGGQKGSAGSRQQLPSADKSGKTLKGKKRDFSEIVRKRELEVERDRVMAVYREQKRRKHAAVE